MYKTKNKNPKKVKITKRQRMQMIMKVDNQIWGTFSFSINSLNFTKIRIFSGAILNCRAV